MDFPDDRGVSEAEAMSRNNRIIIIKNPDSPVRFANVQGLLQLKILAVNLIVFSLFDGEIIILRKQAIPLSVRASRKLK